MQTLWDKQEFLNNLRQIPDAQYRGYGRPQTTWHKKKWGFWTFLAASDVGPAEVYVPKPKGFKRSEEIPVHPVWIENLHVLGTALPPLLIHGLVKYLYPSSEWGYGAAFAFYHLAFIVFATTMIVHIHHYMRVYGTFDEENRARDIAPDVRVKRLAVGIYAYLVLRVLGSLFLTYDKTKSPLDGFSLWSPVKIGAWMVVLDYWFYAYHRSCHQVPGLWWVHRAHHATKHPTPLLSILADDVQEVLEIALLPLLASLVVPLAWPEQWLTMCYMLNIEAMGHSGSRAYWTHPLLGNLLSSFDMELVIEDHDLHHRGGRGGKNFGKQTRIWDKLFNTMDPRIETERARSKAAEENEPKDTHWEGSIDDKDDWGT